MDAVGILASHACADVKEARRLIEARAGPPAGIRSDETLPSTACTLPLPLGNCTKCDPFQSQMPTSDTALQEPKRDCWMDRQLAARETLHGRTATGGNRRLVVGVSGLMGNGTRRASCAALAQLPVWSFVLSAPDTKGLGGGGVCAAADHGVTHPISSPIAGLGLRQAARVPAKGGQWAVFCIRAGARLSEGWIRGFACGGVVGWSYHGSRFDRYGWTECRWMLMLSLS